MFPVFDTEAHRGGRGLMPENTIPAMYNAIDL
ncbi:MAG: glycerophosphodiester phosphodiesterase, partial [Sphingobacteriaceae bacterium]